ncbi:hypothetical protein LOAG_02237 [Loa loa]|uniref:Uncharacterized protein n=1 Tax=Loa loa TaxID=7209 RepID=A0A1S0U7E1_LOALO|nr:hypothetical protein LOAG_02237 [Loa loa]EFO26254.1 hypothetical protein LOAG_02237 [Loa loa]
MELGEMNLEVELEDEDQEYTGTPEPDMTLPLRDQHCSTQSRDMKNIVPARSAWYAFVSCWACWINVSFQLNQKLKLNLQEQKYNKNKSAATVD